MANVESGKKVFFKKGTMENGHNNPVNPFEIVMAAQISNSKYQCAWMGAEKTIFFRGSK